jgi:hypothetical protein
VIVQYFLGWVVTPAGREEAAAVDRRGGFGGEDIRRRSGWLRLVWGGVDLCM